DRRVDVRDQRLVKELLLNQAVRIRIDNWLSEVCGIGRGNRQGCGLSPLLYIIYDEAMMQEVTENMEVRIKCGGELIHAVRFADDKAMMSCSASGLQKLMTKLDYVTEAYGMRINISKTKVMVFAKKTPVQLKIC